MLDIKQVDQDQSPPHCILEHITECLIVRVLLNGGGEHGQPFGSLSLQRHQTLGLLLLIEAAGAVGQRHGQGAHEVLAARQHRFDCRVRRGRATRTPTRSAAVETSGGHGGGVSSSPPA